MYIYEPIVNVAGRSLDEGIAPYVAVGVMLLCAISGLKMLWAIVSLMLKVFGKREVK